MKFQNVMCKVQSIIEQNNDLIHIETKLNQRMSQKSKITLLGEYMDRLIRETISMAVIDSRCTKTVYGQVWLDCYL